MKTLHPIMFKSILKIVERTFLACLTFRKIIQAYKMRRNSRDRCLEMMNQYILLIAKIILKTPLKTCKIISAKKIKKIQGIIIS